MQSLWYSMIPSGTFTAQEILMFFDRRNVTFLPLLHIYVLRSGKEIVFKMKFEFTSLINAWELWLNHKEIVNILKVEFVFQKTDHGKFLSFIGFALKLLLHYFLTHTQIHMDTSKSFLFSITGHKNVKFCMGKPHRIVWYYSRDKRTWIGGDGHSRNYKPTVASSYHKLCNYSKESLGRIET